MSAFWTKEWMNLKLWRHQRKRLRVLKMTNPRNLTRLNKMGRHALMLLTSFNDSNGGCMNMVFLISMDLELLKFLCWYKCRQKCWQKRIIRQNNSRLYNFASLFWWGLTTLRKRLLPRMIPRSKKFTWSFSTTHLLFYYFGSFVNFNSLIQRCKYYILCKE